MTRVFAVAVLFCAALAVTTVEAQCSSCSQTATPAFNQSYSPVNSIVAAPSYAVPQSSFANSYPAPVSQGIEQTYTVFQQPQSSGCCGQQTIATPVGYSTGSIVTSAPTYASPSPSYATPVTTYSAPTGAYAPTSSYGSTGCSSCGGGATSYAPVSTGYVDGSSYDSGCASCGVSVPTRFVQPRSRRIRGRRNTGCSNCY